MHVNYKNRFKHKGKHIFVPNDDCLRRGRKLIKRYASRAKFPTYFYHYQPGGHVAALHRHLENRFFFRIDIQNFYYSISRRRVAATLHDLGHSRARDLATWSCVKNPVAGPSYALPIGFIQSPLLASMVLLRTTLPRAIERATTNGVFVSVYFDDFIGSAPEVAPLVDAYEEVLQACKVGDLPTNVEKLVGPTDPIVAFNCSLEHGRAEVLPERVAKFHGDQPDAPAIAAFETYCARVASINK